MAEDLKQTGKPDDARINVDQEHELNYWSEKLGVSRDGLRKAVQDAGPTVKDVSDICTGKGRNSAHRVGHTNRRRRRFSKRNPDNVRSVLDVVRCGR
jgi:Protein of unknown function (DUF3606)